jgi:hypothetical protein
MGSSIQIWARLPEAEQPPFPLDEFSTWDATCRTGFGGFEPELNALSDLNTTKVRFGPLVNQNAHQVCFDFFRKVRDVLWEVTDLETFQQSVHDKSRRLDLARLCKNLPVIREKLAALGLPETGAIEAAVQREHEVVRAGRGGKRLKTGTGTQETEPLEPSPTVIERSGKEAAKTKTKRRNPNDERDEWVKMQPSSMSGQQVLMALKKLIDSTNSHWKLIGVKRINAIRAASK